MSDRAVMDAQIVRVKDVGTHKSVEVVLHIPTERRIEFIQTFGWPTMADPVPVALARLAYQPAKEEKSEIATEGRAVSSRVPPNYLALEAIKQCKQPKFRAFLEQEFSTSLPNGCHVNTEQDAADLVKHLCEVQSRKDIVPNTPAGDRWERLAGRYAGWERGLQ